MPNKTKPNLNLQNFGKFGNIKWVKSTGLIDYEESMDWMLSKVKNIQEGKEKEIVWLLEHPDIYTAGTSSKSNDLISNNNIKILKTNRGGQWTWHGPGQRVIYLILNLNNKKTDVRWYVNILEELIINTLSEVLIKSERRENFPGVWIKRKINNNWEIKKIAAIGIRISRWIAYHGISININPDLTKYNGIIPCGVKDGGITSLSDQGINISMNKFDEVLSLKFNQLFNEI